MNTLRVPKIACMFDLMEYSEWCNSVRTPLYRPLNETTFKIQGIDLTSVFDRHTKETDIEGKTL